MMSLRRWLALGLISATPLLLHAQERDEAVRDGGILAGTVKDTRGHGLPDADVIILGRGVVARTNLRGEFRVAGLPAADVMVFVRHLGHAPVLYSATPRAVDALRDTVQLAPSPLPLETLEVSELRGTQASLARRLATGQSTILSSERLAQFPTLDDALDAALPIASLSSRGCVLQGTNGAYPSESVLGRVSDVNQPGGAVSDAASVYSAAGASTLNPTVVYTNSGAFDFWATSPGGFYRGTSGTGHIELGMTSSGANITWPTAALPRPSARRTILSPGNLMAVELIPAEHAAANFPGIRNGCGVIQIWQ